MDKKAEVGRFMFEKALDTSQLNQRRAYFVGLASLLIALVSVLLNSNSVEFGRSSIFGFELTISNYFYVKLAITIAAIISGLTVFIFISEALQALIQIDFYAKEGIEEAALFKEAQEYQSAYERTEKIEKFVFPILLSLLVLSVFVLPIFTFAYFGWR